MCPIDYHHFGRRFRQTYACFGCRKAFKARDEFVAEKIPPPHPDRERVFHRVPRRVKCPDCAAEMVRMGRLFRAPPMAKVKAWAALAAVHAGKRYDFAPPFDEPWRREERRRLESARTAADCRAGWTTA